MAIYTYKAKKSTAETVTGQITADTQDDALELINQLGLLPVSIQVQSQGSTKYEHQEHSDKASCCFEYRYTL